MQLWNMYSSQIRKYIGARIEWPAVDDILQQVFVKAHEKMSTLQEPQALKSWLYRIAQYSIVDRYRQEYGWKYGAMDDTYWDGLENDSSDSNHKVILNNISSCLIPMIDSLDGQSKSIMKRYLEPNITQKMIADEVWLSLSNIKVIIHRAKKKLKDKYEECCYQYKDWKWNIIDTRCSKDCGCDNSVLK